MVRSVHELLAGDNSRLSAAHLMRLVESSGLPFHEVGNIVYRSSRTYRGEDMDLLSSMWRLDEQVNPDEVWMAFKAMTRLATTDAKMLMRKATVAELAYVIARARWRLPMSHGSNRYYAMLPVFRSVVEDNSALMWALLADERDDIKGMQALAAKYPYDVAAVFLDALRVEEIIYALDNDIDLELMKAAVA